MRIGEWEIPALTTRDKGGIALTAIGLGEAAMMMDVSGLLFGAVGIGIVLWPRRKSVAETAGHVARVLVRAPIVAKVKVTASASHSLTRSVSATAPVQLKASYRAVLTRADGTTLVRGDS